MISAVDYIKALKIMAKEEILPDDIVEKIKERVKIREEWEASVVLKEDKLMEEELNEEMNEEKKVMKIQKIKNDKRVRACGECKEVELLSYRYLLNNKRAEEKLKMLLSSYVIMALEKKGL